MFEALISQIFDVFLQRTERRASHTLPSWAEYFFSKQAPSGFLDCNSCSDSASKMYQLINSIAQVITVGVTQQQFSNYFSSTIGSINLQVYFQWRKLITYLQFLRYRIQNPSLLGNCAWQSTHKNVKDVISWYGVAFKLTLEFPASSSSTTEARSTMYPVKLDYIKAIPLAPYYFLPPFNWSSTKSLRSFHIFFCQQWLFTGSIKKVLQGIDTYHQLLAEANLHLNPSEPKIFIPAPSPTH